MSTRELFEKREQELRQQHADLLARRVTVRAENAARIQDVEGEIREVVVRHEEVKRILARCPAPTPEPAPAPESGGRR